MVHFIARRRGKGWDEEARSDLDSWETERETETHTSEFPIQSSTADSLFSEEKEEKHGPPWDSYRPYPTDNKPSKFYPATSETSTFATSTKTSSHPPFMETSPTPTGLVIIPTTSSAVPTGDSRGGPGHNGSIPQHEEAGLSHPAKLRLGVGLGVGVTVFALILSIIVIWFCVRRKRQSKLKGDVAQAIAVCDQKVEQVHEMKPKQQPLLSALGPRLSHPSQLRVNAVTPPPPIIVAPLNGRYVTGVDASDMVSVRSANDCHVSNERTGLGDPFADNNSIETLPPPPYRLRGTAPPSYGGTPRSTAPASIATASRNSSLRTVPDPFSYRTSHRGSLSSSIHNPFNDPDDGDTVSMLSDHNYHSLR